MIKEFRNASALKFLLIAAGGFLFQKILAIPYDYSLWLIGTLLAISLISIFLKNNFLVIICILISFGIFTSNRTQNLDFSYNGDFPPQINGLFTGKVQTKLKEKGVTSRYIIEGDLLLGKLQQIKHTRLHFTLINTKKTNLRLQEGNSLFAKLQFRLPNEANLPGEFSEKNYYRSIDVDYTGFAFAQDIAVTDTSTVFGMKQKIFNSISQKIEKMYSPLTSGIIIALILGDQKKIPLEIRQNFSFSGTAHVLSVSGLHVGLIAALIYWIFSFIKIPWLKFSIFSLTLWSYVYLVDMQPAVVRASIMIMLFMFSKVVQRKVSPINIVAFTVLLIAAFAPSTLYSAGFQMSIASIAGIVLLYSPIHLFLQKFTKLNTENFFSKTILASLSMTLSATIVVSPIVAYYFNMFSVISPLANFVTIPLMVFAQSYAILAIILSYVFMPLAGIFAVTSQFCIELSEIITNFSANLPGAYLLGNQTILISIIISLSLLVILTAKHLPQLIFRSIVITVIATLIFISTSFLIRTPPIESYNRPTSQYLELTQTDVAVILEKPTQPGRGYDYGLFSYLNKYDENKKIYYSGPTGDALLQKLQNPKVKFIKIKNSELKFLTSILNL